jgi:hypothetical protein
MYKNILISDIHDSGPKFKKDLDQKKFFLQIVGWFWPQIPKPTSHIESERCGFGVL